MSFEVSDPAQTKLVHLDRIQDKTFSSAWKGYRIEEVRGYLAQVALEVEKLSMELDAARAKIEELGAVKNHGNDGLSTQVLNAEETAAQILHDANEAAKALRDQASRVLEFSRLKAENEARELIESARAQSVELITHDSEVSSGLEFEEASKRELEQARHKATDIIEQAKADGRGMIDQARDLRNEILADLRNKRAVLDGEIADLATRRIEAYQSLARAVQLISEASTIIVSNENHYPSAHGGDDGSDSTVTATWENQDFRQQYYHSESAPAASVIDLGRPTLGDQGRYQAKITSSQVEIGAHLEEGIVRVFHKEVSGPELVKAFVEPSGDLTSDSNDADFRRSGGGDVSIEVEPGQSALVPESHFQIEDGAEPGAPSDLAGERESGLQKAELEGSTVEAVDVQEDQWIDPADSERETPEKFDESLVRSELEDLHQSPSAESDARSNAYDVQRSRRADEILSRIRSLRFGHEASTIPGNRNESANNPTSVGTVTSPKDYLTKGVTTPKIFIQSNIAESIVVDKEIPSDDGAAEEPYYQESDLKDIPQEIDAATQELLDVREDLLAPIATMLFKKVKRLLADEQNDLLDKVRRSSGSEVVLEKLL
ncbi:MAG: DivIVA domain-containing protein, partial [Acidimicrobiaceae bacterium]|nr:DivIVA domain-containing protein [Acidimicrobiaceae bacterium]